MCEVFLRYDPKYVSYIRTIYSISDLLRDMGGLQTALHLIGMVVVTFFAKRIFIAQIVNELYQTKYDRGLGGDDT